MALNKTTTMAFNKTTTSLQGFEEVNAYHRVEGLCLITNQNITFRVCAYKDIAFLAFADNGYSCAYNITGENPIKQAYEYLKTLPEFANATDC